MMKKVLLLALVIASYGLSFAQQTMDLPGKGLPSADKISPSQTSSAKSGGAVNGWYDPDEFIRNNATGPFETFINLVFPDSTVVNIGEDNSSNFVFAHAFGHLYDLRHENWAAVPSDPNNPIMPFAQKDSYTWDSVAFLYLYRRNNADTNVVDTCFIYYYKNSVPNNIDRGSVIFTNGDTMLYATANGLNQQRLSGEAFFKVDTILLTAADTTTFSSTGWGSKFMVRSVNTNIQGTNSTTVSTNPNSWFGYTVTFKPGHAWEPGDTIESRGITKPSKGVNYFGYRYTSVSSGIPPTLRSRRYADNSLLLFNVTRYGQTTANGWSGFMPGVAFNNAVFVHAQALVSGNSTVNVEELKNRGISLGTSYPNPVASGNKMSIDYANKTAQHITIEVFDLLGKKVATVVNEQTEAGEHTATFDVALNPGIYFYTMTAGDVVVGSKKFTVTR